MSAQRQRERPVVPGPTDAVLGQWSPPSRVPPPARKNPCGPVTSTGGFFLLAAAVATAVVAALAVALSSDAVSVPAKSALSDVALLPLAGFVAVAGARAARRATSERIRLGWWLLAAAGVCWLLGELSWYENRFVYQPGADPSWADVFYLAAVVPAAGSLLAFSRGGPPGERVRTLLGALVVGGSVLFVSKALALSVIFPATDGVRALARAVYLAYPITDIVLATLALLVLLKVEPARRLSLTLLALGILAFALTDTWYSYLGALGEYQPGSAWDVGWAVGYALVGLAALAPAASRAQPAAREPHTQEPGYPSSLAVYVPVLVAVVVAVVIPQPPDDPVLIGAGVLVLALFGLRQVLLTRENARLGHTLQGRVGELEQRTVELRLLAEQTERVVTSVVEGVLDVGYDGRIRYANPAAAQLLGRPSAALPGTHERELFPDADAPAQAGSSAIATALRSGEQVTSVSAAFRRDDGTTFPVELALGPVLDHGEVLGIVVVFRDVTERLEVEQMKDEFVSVVSHELRTPLTSMRGSLGLLAAGAVGTLSPKASRLVAIALTSTERLTRLVDDMLDIERLETGASLMELADCDAAQLLRTTVQGVAPLAHENDVSLVVAPSRGRVFADSDRVVQTLTNLVGNAVKFSPPGSAVTLSAAPVDEMVEFRVRDEGRGIPADKLSRIFERFEQVDSSDARQKGGSGLGLAISKSIVERHGGTLRVESALGTGSTFFFALPASREPASATGTAAVAPVPATEPAGRQAAS